MAAGKGGLVAGDDENTRNDPVVANSDYLEFRGGREGEMIDIKSILANPTGSNQGLSIINVLLAGRGECDGTEGKDNTQNNRKKNNQTLLSCPRDDSAKLRITTHSNKDLTNGNRR